MLVGVTRPIGVVEFFFQSPRSTTVTLQLAHGFQCFPGLPGRTDRDRRQVFFYVDDVTGFDITTIALDEDQVDNTSPALNVPSTIKAVLQRLTEETNATTIGPFRVRDSNIRTIGTCRTAVYIPYKYMALALDMNLTVR
jgi:hypothetical protein